MELYSSPSGLADATPFADQRNLVEQRRLDSKDVIARHIAGMINAIQHEELNMLYGRPIGHCEILVETESHVQRKD